MAEYNFKIFFRPGKQMGKVDALTRRYELLEGTKIGEQGKRRIIGEEKFDKESFGIATTIVGGSDEEFWMRRDLPATSLPRISISNVLLTDISDLCESPLP